MLHGPEGCAVVSLLTYDLVCSTWDMCHELECAVSDVHAQVCTIMEDAATALKCGAEGCIAF